MGLLIGDAILEQKVLSVGLGLTDKRDVATPTEIVRPWEIGAAMRAAGFLAHQGGFDHQSRHAKHILSSQPVGSANWRGRT